MNIKFKADAPYAEVVDSIADAFGVVYDVTKTTQDGWQLTDLLTYVGQEPIVREVVNDFPVFIDQFLKLTPKTALDATQEAYNRSKAKYGSIGKYGELFYSILKQAATTYEFGTTTLETGTSVLEGWKKIFAPAKA